MYFQPVLQIRPAGSCASLRYVFTKPTTQQQRTSNPGCEKERVDAEAEYQHISSCHDVKGCLVLW